MAVLSWWSDLSAINERDINLLTSHVVPGAHKKRRVGAENGAENGGYSLEV